jgi:hypothetical protein
MVDVALADLVKSTSESEGTGAFVLDGAVTNFEHFGEALSDGAETWYVIRHENGEEWETGRGTWSTGTNELARDVTVFDGSSGAGTLVDFSAGSKTVSINVPAAMLAKLVNRVDDTVAGTGKSIIGTSEIEDNKLWLRPLVAGPGVSIDDAGDVLTITGGGAPFEPCLFMTVANIALSGVQVCDLGSSSTGDRIAVNAQTAPEENGIYVANDSGAWVRADDANTEAEFVRGRTVMIVSGAVHGGNQYYFSSVQAPSLGVNPINFSLVNEPDSAVPTFAEVLGEDNDADGNVLANIGDGVDPEDASTLGQATALAAAALAGALTADVAEVIVHSTDDNLTVIPTKPLTVVFWTSTRTASRSLSYVSGTDGWRCIIVQAEPAQTEILSIESTGSLLVVNAGSVVVQLIADAAAPAGRTARVIEDGTELRADGAVLLEDGAGVRGVGAVDLTAAAAGSAQVVGGAKSTAGGNAGAAVIRGGAHMNSGGVGGNVELNAGSGDTKGFVSVQVAGNERFKFADTEHDAKSIGIIAIPYLSQSGTGLPATGLVRFAHSVNGTGQITGRNTANDADVSILNWGLANNRLVLGATACERMTFDVNAAGFVEVRTGGTTRMTWEATVVGSALPWARGNAASTHMRSYPSSAQTVATDTDFDTSQTVVQTVTLEAGKQYMFTATATVKDAAGTGGNILWTRTIFSRYYRKATGGAVQANAGAGDTGGKECHLFEAAGSENDFTFVSAVSGDNVTFTLTNVAGANNLEGDVEITWSEMPLR